jgi:hypothetical protein
MGWASYLEDNVEKADDRAFMAQTFLYECPSRTSQVAVKSSALSEPQMTVVPSAAPSPAISVAERCRKIRDVHVLSLAELRPKARPAYFGRAYSTVLGHC